MRQAELVEDEELVLKEVDKLEPDKSEIRIRVKACGVCGSDVHSYKGEHPFVSPPIVLGHEFSGIIDSTGVNASKYEVGDKVVVEPNITCGDCHNCQNGSYNICENLKVIGNVGYDGAFADYITVPEDKALKIPDQMSFEEGALVEPVAVGAHAVRISNQELGDKVLILGAGTIGLTTMLAAKDAGASEVIITDLKDERLYRAERLGADYTISIGDSEAKLSSFVKRQFGEDKSDIIYDCVGFASTLNQAINLARKGTQIVLVGVPQGELKTNMAFVQDRELDILGSLMYVKKDFRKAIQLVYEGLVDSNEFITHKYSLEKIEEAFELAADSSDMDDKLKVMIEI